MDIRSTHEYVRNAFRKTYTNEHVVGGAASMLGSLGPRNILVAAAYERGVKGIMDAVSHAKFSWGTGFLQITRGAVAVSVQDKAKKFMQHTLADHPPFFKTFAALSLITTIGTGTALTVEVPIMRSELRTFPSTPLFRMCSASVVAAMVRESAFASFIFFSEGLPFVPTLLGATFATSTAHRLLVVAATNDLKETPGKTIPNFYRDGLFKTLKNLACNEGAYTHESWKGPILNAKTLTEKLSNLAFFGGGIPTFFWRAVFLGTVRVSLDKGKEFAKSLQESEPETAPRMK